MMSSFPGLFFVFASLILITAGLVAFRPRPVESAMWLILNFFVTAALYAMMGSHFVAVIQVLVYAGAILVLFVFVILLLNLDPRELGSEGKLPWGSMVLFVAFLSFFLLCLHIATPKLLEPLAIQSSDRAFGTIESLSAALLSRYVFGFEAAGIILLLAILGVGLLAYRKRSVVKV